ncbi:hypothetical protein T265_11540 [Opisthorchis viverrini]|uniref:Uncharacterized protein n=1 Tax=Opisthorchis viverrini TaxID=6198 RepID=A0A074Z956_OPIVI|nr:hypothetical protein T265_11540 [Opisthorchis viverrini]KER19760.1 hypothetical protein T265_11540 [Opisthorchis viverrini]
MLLSFLALPGAPNREQSDALIPEVDIPSLPGCSLNDTVLDGQILVVVSSTPPCTYVVQSPNSKGPNNNLIHNPMLTT